MDMSIQGLINSGMAWRLEGAVGREAMRWIEDGYAILGEHGNRDYYGTYVPSRHEVKAGTMGSVRYANRLRRQRDERPLRARDFDAGYGAYSPDFYEDEDYD